MTECVVSSICLDGKADLSCGVVNCNMILALECRTIIRYSFIGVYTAMWLAFEYTSMHYLHPRLFAVRMAPHAPAVYTQRNTVLFALEFHIKEQMFLIHVRE